MIKIFNDTNSQNQTKLISVINYWFEIAQHCTAELRKKRPNVILELTNSETLLTKVTAQQLMEQSLLKEKSLEHLYSKNVSVTTQAFWMNPFNIKYYELITKHGGPGPRFTGKDAFSAFNCFLHKYGLPCAA